MKKPWFSRIGVCFLPRAFGGWAVLLAAVAVAVYVFVDVDSRSHSVSDTLMNFIFRLLVIAVVYSAIGFAASRGKSAATN